jgi:hypothetical protein
MIQGENLGGNDGTRPTTNPTDGRRAWNADMSEQIRVALVTDEVAHSVVIDTSTAGGRHASCSSRPPREARVSDADSLCDFACVAVACARIRNVLIRSCAKIGGQGKMAPKMTIHTLLLARSTGFTAPSYSMSPEHPTLTYGKRH